MLRSHHAVTACEQGGPVACTRTPREGTTVPLESLAGVRPPETGEWLLVTKCQEPDGPFTGRVLASPLPHAHGGDVLVRVSADERHSGPELARVQVLAVVRAKLVRVAMWESPELSSWPGRVRPAVLFAVTALDWLAARGADTGAPRPCTTSSPPPPAPSSPWRRSPR